MHRTGSQPRRPSRRGHGPEAVSGSARQGAHPVPWSLFRLPFGGVSPPNIHTGLPRGAHSDLVWDPDRTGTSWEVLSKGVPCRGLKCLTRFLRPPCDQETGDGGVAECDPKPLARDEAADSWHQAGAGAGRGEAEAGGEGTPLDRSVRPRCVFTQHCELPRTWGCEAWGRKEGIGGGQVPGRCCQCPELQPGAPRGHTRKAI